LHVPFHGDLNALRVCDVKKKKRKEKRKEKKREKERKHYKNFVPRALAPVLVVTGADLTSRGYERVIQSSSESVGRCRFDISSHRLRMRNDLLGGFYVARNDM
jgi:hypothetical protein